MPQPSPELEELRQKLQEETNIFQAALKKAGLGTEYQNLLELEAQFKKMCKREGIPIR